MLMPPRIPTLVLVCAALLSAAPPVPAQGWDGRNGLLAGPPGRSDAGRSDDPQGQDAGRPPAGLSRDEAVARVREQTGGRVVRAERREAGGRVIYEVRVVTPDGRVRDYRVDAATGRLW